MEDIFEIILLMLNVMILKQHYTFIIRSTIVEKYASPEDWKNAAMFYVDWTLNVFRRMNINIF